MKQPSESTGVMGNFVWAKMAEVTIYKVYRKDWQIFLIRVVADSQVCTEEAKCRYQSITIKVVNMSGLCVSNWQVYKKEVTMYHISAAL